MIVPKSGTPYTVWPVIHAELTARNLQSVTAAEAAKMQQQGWTLLDVRLEGDFDASHAADSVNISLYRFTAGNELWDKIKRVAMAGFAMKATERDPDFADKVAARFKKNQKLIVVCAIGGTLDTKLRLRPDKYKDGVKDLDRSFGRESRSLKACYQLMKAGWTSSNLVFMEGGVQQWRFQGFPVEASA
ncbi:rhodanese domain-containing protein, partial [Haematococcus lacustris]